MDKSSYEIHETQTFQDDLDRLAPPTSARLRRKITGFVCSILREQPHHGPWIKKLKGRSPGTWRFRIGAWRLFYEIDESRRAVYLTALDDRKNAYR